MKGLSVWLGEPRGPSSYVVSNKLTGSQLCCEKSGWTEKLSEAWGVLVQMQSFRWITPCQDPNLPRHKKRGSVADQPRFRCLRRLICAAA